MSSGPQFQSPIQLNIGQSVPSGFDPEIRAAIEPLYTAVNQLLQAFTQYAGVAPQQDSDWPQLSPDMSLLLQNMGRLYVIFDSAVPYGNTVDLYNNAGVLTARKANATTNARPCRGIVSSVAGASGAGAYAEVMLCGCVAGLSGMTRGQNFFQSTTAGLIVNTPPVAAGNIEQFVGFALSDTLLWFHPGYWIQH